MDDTLEQDALRIQGVILNPIIKKASTVLVEGSDRVIKIAQQILQIREGYDLLLQRLGSGDESVRAEIEGINAETEQLMNEMCGASEEARQSAVIMQKEGGVVLSAFCRFADSLEEIVRRKQSFSGEQRE